MGDTDSLKFKIYHLRVSELHLDRSILLIGVVGCCTSAALNWAVDDDH